MLSFWDEGPSKRTLGIRDKQILYRNAKGRCQNPACGKKIEFADMQVGHKKAASKGGKATFKNCVCLCYTCNKLQGTDSWKTFLKKQGVKTESSKSRVTLEGLSMPQLKFLAQKHHIKVKGRVEESIFESYRKPPSKAQYVKALARVVSEKDINSELKGMPRVEKKKRKRRREESIFDW